MFVDDDATALVQLHAGVVGQQPGGIGAAAHGDQQLVDDELLLAVLVGVDQVYAVLLHLGLAELGVEPDVQALLGEFPCRHLGDVRVGGGEELRQRLDHRDLGAEPAPYAAQLQADHAGADHAKALRHGVELQRTGVVDDVLAVEFRERQLDRHRTGSQDHVGGRDGLLAAVVAGDLDLVAFQQLAGAEVAGDLVGLEQLGHAAGELLDDLFLAPDEGLEVDLGILDGDAVHGKIVREVVELLGGIEQRLRRDAAHVEAGAAQRLLAILADKGVDAGRLQAQLRGADRGVVTGRASADDDDIVFFAHFIRSRE